MLIAAVARGVGVPFQFQELDTRAAGLLPCELGRPFQSFISGSYILWNLYRLISELIVMDILPGWFSTGLRNETQ